MCVLGVSLILVSTFFFRWGEVLRKKQSFLVSPFYVLYTSCMMIQQDCDKKSPPVKPFFLNPTFLSFFYFLFFLRAGGKGE